MEGIKEREKVKVSQVKRHKRQRRPQWPLSQRRLPPVWRQWSRLQNLFIPRLALSPASTPLQFRAILSSILDLIIINGTQLLGTRAKFSLSLDFFLLLSTTTLQQVKDFLQQLTVHSSAWAVESECSTVIDMCGRINQRPVELVNWIVLSRGAEELLSEWVRQDKKAVKVSSSSFLVAHTRHIPNWRKYLGQEQHTTRLVLIT